MQYMRRAARIYESVKTGNMDDAFPLCIYVISNF